MRAIWLALPLLLVIALDGFFTLRAQPQARGQECPLVRILPGHGPLVLCAWAGIALVLAKVLPGLLGQAFYGSVLLGHAWESASWIPGVAVRGLKALGDAGASLARDPRLGYGSTLAYLSLLCLFTVFCWRRAGLIPAEAAKARKPADKGGKKGKD